MNKYLARLKAKKSEKCLGGEHSKSSKLNFDDFESAHTRHVSLKKGNPHCVYGHDEFSPLRLRRPTIDGKAKCSRW
jgi:hypothetical protein